MHLRAIKLRGFKSFPDPVEVRLEPGVAVVVGPNGSGKSNVADGIVWAAGSLAPSELRAEKPGGAKRRPRPSIGCAVRASGSNCGEKAPPHYSKTCAQSSHDRVAFSTRACVPSARP